MSKMSSHKSYTFNYLDGRKGIPLWLTLILAGGRARYYHGLVVNVNGEEIHITGIEQALAIIAKEHLIEMPEDVCRKLADVENLGTDSLVWYH